MMRALYTAASGMRAQQTNVDNISNNIANVNTTAFKSQKTEFKSLLYQTIQTRTTSANGEENRSERRWDLEQELRPTPQAIRRVRCSRMRANLLLQSKEMDSFR